MTLPKKQRLLARVTILSLKAGTYLNRLFVSYHLRLYIHDPKEEFLKNTLRDRGSTAQYTAHDVDCINFPQFSWSFRLWFHWFRAIRKSFGLILANIFNVLTDTAVHNHCHTPLTSFFFRENTKLQKRVYFHWTKIWLASTFRVQIGEIEIMTQRRRLQQFRRKGRSSSPQV